MPQTLNRTYEELVQKAQKLFWLKGYKGVTTKDLANYLDVSASTIYNKYSKEMLFMDSVEYYISTCSDPFLSQLRKSSGGKDSLRDFFYKMIDVLIDKTFPRSCLMVNTVVEMRNENQEIIKLYQRYFNALISSYKVVLEKAIELGQIKHPEKKDEYAEFLLGVIFGLSILYKINDKENLQKFIDEQLSFVV